MSQRMRFEVRGANEEVRRAAATFSSCFIRTWNFALLDTRIESAAMDSTRAFLRHTLATLAYRGGKSVRGAPPEFAAFKADATSRTPAQILAHIGDLLEWMLSIARGQQAWNNSEPLAWDDGVARFHRCLGEADAYFESSEPLH